MKKIESWEELKKMESREELKKIESREELKKIESWEELKKIESQDDHVSEGLDPGIINQQSKQHSLKLAHIGIPSC